MPDRDRLFKEQPDLVTLERTLLKLGGKSVSLVYEEDLGKILSRGGVVKRRVHIEKGEPSRCHQNISLLREANGPRLKLYSGYALSPDGIWRQHSWGLWRGKIVETTEERSQYFGFQLTDAEAEDFVSLNAYGGLHYSPLCPKRRP